MVSRAVEILTLPLVHTFTISRASQAVARSVIVRLHDGTHEGLGETSPSARYGESVEGVVAELESRAWHCRDPFALESLLQEYPYGARCALDVALHDVIGKRLGIPLWRYFGLDPARTPVTSFTIAIASPEAMLERLEAIRDHPVIKVKLGFEGDVDVVEAMRTRYSGILRVDANEGWTPEEAVEKLERLARCEVEFCEQPIAAGTPERLRWISERSRVPIVADEDARDAAAIGKLGGCVAGVNVKLVKCGGLREALKAIHTARALGLKVMLGCMVESAVLTTAAAHLSPLVDWADLDGPFLTSRDPFAGVRYERGKLVLPDLPGLGVVEREPATTPAP